MILFLFISKSAPYIFQSQKVHYLRAIKKHHVKRNIIIARNNDINFWIIELANYVPHCFNQKLRESHFMKVFRLLSLDFSAYGLR